VRKKFFIVCAIIIITALVGTISLVGCKSKSAAETTAAETTAAETTAAETTAAETAAAETAAATGKTIQIYMIEGGETEGIRPVIEKFSSETGIKTEITVGPYSTMNETMTLALTADKGAYDVLMTPGEWLTGWVVADFLVPLSDGLYTEVDPDFVKGLIDLYTVGGKLYAVPWFSNPHITYFRKDLFEQYGLKFPKTIEEELEVAKKLTLDTNNDGEIDIYGRALAGGMGVHTAYEFIEDVWTFGGEILDASGNPVFNNEAGLKALQHMLDIAYKYKECPPWFLETDLAKHMVEFSEGKLAMANSFPYYSGSVSDPKTSVVYDKFDIATKVGICGLSGWAFSITSGSDVPNESIQMIKYITSFEGLKEATINSGIAAGRYSVIEDAEVNKKWPYEKGVYLEAFKNGRAYPPTMDPNWAEIESNLWTELNLALSLKKEPQAALDDAVAKAKSILGLQ
jgi:multiple sugar transport system substrate-binding protein